MKPSILHGRHHHYSWPEVGAAAILLRKRVNWRRKSRDVAAAEVVTQLKCWTDAGGDWSHVESTDMMWYPPTSSPNGCTVADDCLMIQPSTCHYCCYSGAGSCRLSVVAVVRVHNHILTDAVSDSTVRQLLPGTNVTCWVKLSVIGGHQLHGQVFISHQHYSL